MRKSAKPVLEYPVCVRELKARKDARLRQFFLCDTCAKVWSVDAFNRNQPLYVGERVEGFCQLCNKGEDSNILTS